MMITYLIGIFLFIIFVIVWICWFSRLYGFVHERVDGVETIDGIRYLVSATDVGYIMYKLGSTFQSKYVQKHEFEKLSDHEGIITFYGPTLHGFSNNMNSARGLLLENNGIAYRIKCTEWNQDVIMEISLYDPGPRIYKKWYLNRAFHCFFKEVFDVKVIER